MFLFKEWNHQDEIKEITPVFQDFTYIEYRLFKFGY